MTEFAEAPPAHLAAGAPPPPQEDAFFDPRMGDRGLRKLERRARPTFEFVQEGEFQKQAEIFRSVQLCCWTQCCGCGVLPSGVGAEVRGFPVG
jgi:hypothetical protein